MLKTPRRRGGRGLDPEALVAASLDEIERGGRDGFSLRCAARAIGCDVATLSYRFGSKEGLERAIADRLHADIKLPSGNLPWQDRATEVARQYRRVAQRYPQAFPLLLQFWTSGPCDLAIAEYWHQALAEAGVPLKEIPQVGCATYAGILGLCASEVSGLLGIPTAETLAVVENQDDLELTRQLLPVFEALGPDPVFETALELMIAGIESRYPVRRAGHKSKTATRSRARQKAATRPAARSGLGRGKSPR